MKTHCKRGHEFTEENTYIRKDTGARQCRKCIEFRGKSNYVYSTRTLVTDPSDLLLETPEAYYWMGVILTDGTFEYTDSGKPESLRLVWQEKDYEHLVKFSNFIRSKNPPTLFNTGGEVTILKRKVFTQPTYKVYSSGINIISKITEKFDIRKRKTYNPPSSSIIPKNDNLLVGLLAGIIDGDGSVYLRPGRKVPRFTITAHNNWRPFYESLIIRIEALGLILDGVHIHQRKNISCINIEFQDARFASYLRTKTIELGIPLLLRKWNVVLF